MSFCKLYAHQVNVYTRKSESTMLRSLKGELGYELSRSKWSNPDSSSSGYLLSDCSMADSVIAFRCSSVIYSHLLLSPSYFTPLCNRLPESLAPSIFLNPQEILYDPSYLNFSQAPLTFKCLPCIILSCPQIILFGGGAKNFRIPPKNSNAP